jgi:hypothetical protein
VLPDGLVTLLRRSEPTVLGVIPKEKWDAHAHWMVFCERVEFADEKQRVEAYQSFCEAWSAMNEKGETNAE